MPKAVPNRGKAKRARPAKAKRVRAAWLDEKIAGLTPSNEELLDYAAQNPVPEAFLQGEDDPSQPPKAPAKR